MGEEPRSNDRPSSIRLQLRKPDPLFSSHATI
nr:MAG TPA: hypothetical protein [Caudoviricetes sp.]DAL21521.1 MAG TPA_asm: hypothetical protein [Caudoviricetes sp.]DAU50168.1 MAG TPA: hypothetical protein [Caudoviricetes sp.]